MLAGLIDATPTVPWLGVIVLVCRLVYSTQMLFVPLGGALVNVNDVPDTVNAEEGFWATLATNTIICAELTTALGKVKDVAVPLPEK